MRPAVKLLAPLLLFLPQAQGGFCLSPLQQPFLQSRGHGGASPAIKMHTAACVCKSSSCRQHRRPYQWPSSESAQDQHPKAQPLHIQRICRAVLPGLIWETPGKQYSHQNEMGSNVVSAASQCTCIVMKVAMFLDFERLIPDQEDPASLVLQSHAACIPKDVACDQMSILGHVPCCYDVLTLHLPAISMQRQPPHAVISPLEI